MSQVKVYGPHLLLEGYGANPISLQDSKLIYNFLDELPGLIGMTKIKQPDVVVFEDEDKAGVTGIVMIVTSHISIHTYSLKRCFFLDVFSCKDFDSKIVVDKARETFDQTWSTHQVIDRGTNFPIDNLV